MEERFNKPKVFLSHSKKNSNFIEKLADDLRKCQIDPWLDTDQIRHGKSWQDSIFEFGLPTCDAIIVYFTEISIQSAVVKKEMDAGLLQSIKDSKVAFLPYVNNETLRSELRPDIQTLQVLEWNDANYYSLLPRVVAEIWRSYLERTIEGAVKTERLKRVQLELELEKRRDQSESIFLPSEEKEFKYIYEKLDREIETTISKSGYTKFDVKMEKRPEKIKVEYLITANLLSVLMTQKLDEMNEFESYSLWKPIFDASRNFIKDIPVPEEIEGRWTYDYGKISDYLDELLVYGLVETILNNNSLGSRQVVTNRFLRFKYWLTFYGNLPIKIVFNIGEQPNIN